jgi:hypothetical protein
MAAVQAASERAATIDAALTQAAAGGAGCQELIARIARERQGLASVLAAAGPGSTAASAAASQTADPPESCLVQQVNSFNALVQRFNGLTEPGRVRPDRRASLEALGERMSRLQRHLSAPSRVEADCMAGEAELAQVRRELEQLAEPR